MRGKSLSISENIFDEMISHCRDIYPNEACGILAGKGSEALKVYKMANIEKSPVSYEFDSREHIKAIRDMRENNHTMLAIFHSHPSSQAYPSAKDMNLAFYEDCIYVIVSLSASGGEKQRGCKSKRPVVKGFLIREGNVKNVSLLIHDKM
ncbi:MAG: M67 family metallopeptidase [Thermodesulfovibrionales bacterium]|nr:M67 family metallopeptidase [Thermodesulfovibrionales bacterium]